MYREPLTKECANNDRCLDTVTGPSGSMGVRSILRLPGDARGASPSVYRSGSPASGPDHNGASERWNILPRAVRRWNTDPCSGFRRFVQKNNPRSPHISSVSGEPGKGGASVWSMCGGGGGSAASRRSPVRVRWSRPRGVHIVVHPRSGHRPSLLVQGLIQSDLCGEDDDVSGCCDQKEARLWSFANRLWPATFRVASLDITSRFCISAQRGGRSP